MSTVHVLMPPGIDDPLRPSGGNRYDRRLCDCLTAVGWDVRERFVPGDWPAPEPPALAALASVLAAVPDDGVVLLDGLLVSCAAEVLAPESARLRLVGLVHMPQPDGVPDLADEERALRRMRAVLTTSEWTRRRLIEDHALAPDRIHVALPGVEPAPLTAGTSSGRCLLAVGALLPHKGQDLLVDALRRIERPYRCTVVGPLDRAPAFVDALRREAADLGNRFRLTGPLAGAELADAYASADVLVLPSRSESFGLVVLEALAAGLPIIGFRVGGVPEALGDGPAGRPGMLVPPEDPAALAGALSAWLADAGLRSRLRRAALARRADLPGWDRTADGVGAVLAAVAP